MKTLPRMTLAASFSWVVLPWAGHLLAADPPTDNEQDIEEIHVARNFSELDQNKDGLLTREEAELHEQLSGEFDCSDTDEDGRISLEEFQAFSRLDESE